MKKAKNKDDEEAVGDEEAGPKGEHAGKRKRAEEDKEEEPGHDPKEEEEEKNESEKPETKKIEPNKKPARKMPKKTTAEKPGEDEKPKKTTTSFARRPCPKTSPASDRWQAIQGTFKTMVMPRIQAEGGASYAWEDWG